MAEDSDHSFELTSSIMRSCEELQQTTTYSYLGSKEKKVFDEYIYIYMAKGWNEAEVDSSK